MRLVKASVDPPEGLLDFLMEIGEGENGFGGVPEITRGDLSLDAYLRREVARSRGESLPEGYVPNTTYWLLDDNRHIVGMSRLRHALNESLLHHGGHIGYYIRPNARGKGYGTKLLELILEEARSLGIAGALLTVNTSNEPSWRLVETNGGVMEDERLNDDGSPFRRYWIDLTP